MALQIRDSLETMSSAFHLHQSTKTLQSIRVINRDVEIAPWNHQALIFRNAGHAIIISNKRSMLKEHRLHKAQQLYVARKIWSKQFSKHKGREQSLMVARQKKQKMYVNKFKGKSFAVLHPMKYIWIRWLRYDGRWMFKIHGAHFANSCEFNSLSQG